MNSIELLQAEIKCHSENLLEYYRVCRETGTKVNQNFVRSFESSIRNTKKALNLLLFPPKRKKRYY